MSLLTMAPHEVSNALNYMSPQEIEQNAPVIERLLTHRSQPVRGSAAAALGRAKLAASKLRSRLAKERNELVLCDLCEALGNQADVASASRLRRLANSNRSWLVRSYAATALADVLGHAAADDLVKALKREKSRRALANLNLALFSIGVEEVLPAILKGLGSRDSVVRYWIANTLAEVHPRRHHAALLTAVIKAVAAEKHVAVREALEKAASALAPSRPGKARPSSHRSRSPARSQPSRRPTK